MAPVPGTTYWLRLERIEPGSLHTYRYRVGGEWGQGGDVAGYTARSYELPDATRGTLSDERVVRSRIYRDAITKYRLYANHGIDETRGAPVMIWHDGHCRLEPHDLFHYRMQIVTDNLVRLGSIPPMVHVLVPPSSPGEHLAERFPGEDQANAMRSLQYDTVSDRYGRHLVEEVLPDAARAVKLRTDAYSRGAAGSSSGGICAFTLGWLLPGEVSRVQSAIGSFTGLQSSPGTKLIGGFMLPHLVRREPRRNIRVWLSGGANDLEVGPTGRADLFAAGSWPLNNIQLANALKLAGYDFRFRFGPGHHTTGQAALDLPQSLAWLWRDYDPDLTYQRFEQEASERAKPVFRVRIANRKA
jgi:enterochelin esterase family protein